MASKDSSSKSSKSKSKSKKEKSEKKSHHVSGQKMHECGKAIMGALAKYKNKPHYTSRYIASSNSSIGKKFGSDIVRAALANLQENDAITFSRKDGGKHKKGQFYIMPIARKAA